MKNRKKGFTIVELVIVIAVIGILSAVLIPVFSGLIAKANLANDNSIVSNINTQLQASEITDGKNVTMYDALQDAKEAGYLVQNINAKSNNQLVWDSTIDRFALIDVEGNVISGELRATKDYDLWKISNVVDAKYSTYYTGNETTINTSKGFDAGENEAIAAINYSNSGTAQNVVIRTNGGTLTINAEQDTVFHYGEADVVNVEAVANESYHEKGAVALMKVAQGRVVAEDNSRISTLYIEGNEVKVNIEQQAEVDLVAKAEGVEPQEVKVAGVEKKTEIPAATEETIETFHEAASRYAGGNGTEEYPYLISKYEHVNVSLRGDMANYVGDYNNATGGKYYKLIADIDLGDNFVPLGSVNYTLKSTYSAIVNTSSYKDAFQGSLDGDGHTIILRQNGNVGCLFGFVSALNGGEYIKNINLNVNIVSTGTAAGLAKQFNMGSSNRAYSIENIVVTGNMIGYGNVSGILNTESDLAGTTFTFKNCVNKANLTVNKMSGFDYVLCAGIASQAGVTSKNATVILENCRNEGDLIAMGTFADENWSIMGHMVAQVTNSSYTSNVVSTMKCINCSFRVDAKIEGYSKANGSNSHFEGLDKRVNKNTFTGEANFNKKLIGGNAMSTVLIGETLDTATEYTRTSSANVFAHGGTEAAPGRTSSTVANYPA